MVVQGQMVDAGMKLTGSRTCGLVMGAGADLRTGPAVSETRARGDVSQLSYLAGPGISRPLTYIYPNVDEKTRTARVRMEFHNPGYFLKPGMFATVQISAELGAFGVAGAGYGGFAERRKKYGVCGERGRQVRSADDTYWSAG